MATPFYLYGSSPDALAQQQQGYERLYLGANESNRAAKAQADAQSLSAFLDAQRQDDSARERDASLRFNAWRSQRADSTDATRFAQESERLANDRLRIAQIGKKDTLLEQGAAAKLAATELAKNAKIQEDLAAQDAQLGKIDDEAHARRLYPLLTPDLHKLYSAQSKQVRDEYGQLQGAADTLNDQDRIKNYIRLSQDAIKDMPSRVRTPPTFGQALTDVATMPYGPLRAIGAAYGTANPDIAYENQRIKDWQASLNTADPNTLGSRAGRILNDKKVFPALVADPATGQYIPQERPAWLPPTTATASTGGFNAPEDVRAAFRSGAITRAQAAAILQSQFGME